MEEERRITSDLTNSVLRHLDGFPVFTRVVRERRVALEFSELRQMRCRPLFSVSACPQWKSHPATRGEGRNKQSRHTRSLRRNNAGGRKEGGSLQTGEIHERDTKGVVWWWEKKKFEGKGATQMVV
jgi:hypothetical protein